MVLTPNDSGVILSADKTALHQTVAERVDSISVVSPGQDLYPADVGEAIRLLGVVASQHEGVVG